MPDEVPEKAMWERQNIQTFKIESDNHFLKAVVALLYAFTMRIVDLYLYLETI